MANSDELLECPACEGLGEVQIGSVWSQCRLCSGEGGLTQRALDGAYCEAGVELWMLPRGQSVCSVCGKLPRQ